MGAFSRLKGVADLYGPDLARFRAMELAAQAVFPRYGFEELRPPILESTGLFQRGIGQETDVVQKEMFTFADRKGRSLALRPEATAGVLRAAIELGLARQGQIARLFTIGPMFRYERPQKGRQRQFHQINCECLGSESPYADVELIAMLFQFLDSLKLDNLALKINSLGCRNCRPGYLAKLQAFLASLPEGDFCQDCQRRMTANPLRVLDCKVDQARLADAPRLMDNLCAACEGHFKTVLALLTDIGIAYEIDDHLVRGLDYYERTTFEVTSGQIGAQTAVAGGGRYDGLVAQLGGPETPGVGFACGMERISLLLPEQEAARPDFYLVSLTSEARTAAFVLAQNLRQQGFAGEMGYGDGSLKSQLRQVSRAGAKFCLILGSDELAQATISVKNMDNGCQTTAPLADIATLLTL